MLEFIQTFTAADGIGVVGSLMICAAYFFLSTKRITSDQFNYHFLNFLGSGLLLVSLYFRPNPGAILIEIIWASIAIYSICNARVTKPNSDSM